MATHGASSSLRSRIRLHLYGLLIALLAVAMAWATWSVSRPGLALPPSESRRVRHPGGFSIIVPPGWESLGNDVTPGRESISLLPRTRVRDDSTYCVVSEVGSGAAGQVRRDHRFEPAEFQGCPAEIYVGLQERYSSWQALFERNGRWYHLTLMLPGKQSPMPPEDYLAYLNTFAVDASPGTKPAGGRADPTIK